MNGFSRPLLDGIPGTLQTLEIMAQAIRSDAVNPTVRQIALQIVRDCPGHAFDCEIQKLFDYVQKRIVYRHDPINLERVQDTIRTVQVFKTGDCDDKIVALAGLLGSIGHISRLVVIGQSSRSQFGHVFLEVLTKKKGWISLDPTPEDAPIGFEGQAVIRHTYDIWDQPGADWGSAAVILLVLWLWKKD